MPMRPCQYCKTPTEYVLQGEPTCPRCNADTKAPLYSLPGGATRSEKKPMYHLVPMEGMARTAQRFTLGAATYGDSNWKRSLKTEADAAAFCKETYNHMMEHMLKMGQGVEPEDDHLGAIGWAQAALCHVEGIFEKPWWSLGSGEVSK